MHKYFALANTTCGGDFMSERRSEKRPGILGLLLRIVVNSIVLLIVSFLVPGFSILGIWPAILAAIVIAILDYAVEAIFKVDASPFGRGITGFIIAALIIYLTQFFVSGVAISFWGAIIGALLIGLADLVLPGRIM
jgi:putative membrane protein